VAKAAHRHRRIYCELKYSNSHGITFMNALTQSKSMSLQHHQSPISPQLLSLQATRGPPFPTKSKTQTSIKLIKELARIQSADKRVTLAQTAGCGQPGSSQRAQVLDLVDVRLHWHVKRVGGGRTTDFLGLRPGNDPGCNLV
jgi:hypothetical protein